MLRLRAASALVKTAQIDRQRDASVLMTSSREQAKRKHPVGAGLTEFTEPAQYPSDQLLGTKQHTEGYAAWLSAPSRFLTACSSATG